MITGVLIGKFLPSVPTFFSQFEYAKVSIPMAILIWVMIYPMMMKVNFESVKNVGKNPKGLYVTWVVNWLIKPFTMFAIASFFFYVVFKGLIPAELGKEYLAGAVLLGAAPCTAMVFVWSQLTKGNPAYTVVQVATNDLIILVVFVPIVKFLLGVSKVNVPWDTLIISVVLFVVVPLTAGVLTRMFVSKKKGTEYFENQFLPKFDNATIVGASNFFELSVAVAIALFGMDSPAALATVVGVLTEVPIMLMLVKIANKTTHWFPESSNVEENKIG